MLSIAVTAGLVAFAFMVLRILFNTLKAIIRKVQASRSKKN